MRISRTTGAFSGFLLVILGIWGGIIPFIGPSFGYAFGNHVTWYYTADRLYLDILPGVAVIVGGLILLRAGNRAAGVLGSWLAIAGGAWFVVGPSVSLLWEHGVGPIGAPLFGTTRQMLELVGYFYGLGALIIALGAFALGRFVSRPALVVDEPAAAEPVPAARQPVAASEPERVAAPEPAATREPVAAPEPAATREPVADPEPAATREPVADDPDADHSIPAVDAPYQPTRESEHAPTGSVTGAL